jgi:hypothetical protein
MKKMEIEELKKMLLDHEERINKLEGKEVDTNITLPLNSSKKGFKGLSGGIRFLITNKFFDSPKSLNEIIEELKREGYHYSKSGVASTLSETFTKSQKVLNRINQEGAWMYVLRK